MKCKCVFIVLLSLFSINALCQEGKKVRLVYGAKGILLPIAAECTPESFEQSFGESLNFLTTYDDIFIAWFIYYMERLKPEKYQERTIDPRIMIISYNEDVHNDTLYLGEHHGISKNGIVMKDDEEFLNLIKRKIGWGIESFPLASDSILYPPISLDSIR